MGGLSRLGWTLVVGYAAVVIVALLTVVVPELRDAGAPDAAESPTEAEP